MKFRIRFTEEARDDLHRLYDFLLAHSDGDARQAEAAVGALRKGLDLLETSPFACRRCAGQDPMLRELLVGFGATGYVILVEIESPAHVNVLAIRHQREDDYR
jgi:plasmid stabilization system protein ParE